MVTIVTMIWGVGAVLKRPSPSSQPSQGARQEVKGAYLRVEIAARQYNPYPLTSCLRNTLAGWRERLWPFPPAQRRVTKFRWGAGCPFQRAALLGRQPQLPGQSPLHPVGRKGAFDTECQKCLCVTFAESNAKAAAKAAKGTDWKGV